MPPDRAAGQIAQPTGPQPLGGTDPPPEARAAAGRDIRRATSALPHPGHRTSTSSDLRMTSSSKVFPQGAQAYS